MPGPRSNIEVSDLQDLKEIGTSILGRPVTQTFYVSPNGSGTDGLTWVTAFKTIQAALDAASTDENDCTLIMISPHGASFYDIDTTGDPTWSANVILSGTSRSWSKIKNNHDTATSIMKFTGRVFLNKLNFNLGTSNNGVIVTRGGARVRDCLFIGEDLTEAATGLHFDGVIKHVKAIDCDFLGEGLTHFTGLLLDRCVRGSFCCLRFHDCKSAVQIIHVDSDLNQFEELDVGDCGIGFDIDAGNEQELRSVTFHNNTKNIDDEVGDHIYGDLRGEFPITITPDDFTGVQITTHANPDTWGNDTEIIAAAAIDAPFRIVAINIDPSAAEKFKVRFSHDSGASHFDSKLVENLEKKRASASSPSGTEFIFNKGTRISASSKSESGSNNVKVWLEIQEI